ncbi:lytic transglycosylase domain-containing protein [Pseudoroseicyclus aestuarii]|uniref:Transglycosylase-like protein with SLT domain n=1 Tax=Pseudoroseicyclus aestuarii TaxID=1795041 RepID=A0A318SSI8_9RHOB|nr:lytic transglycosylase domain-containing protein [Pseudoroseicyclus aestuarii]PYE84502.1 hypothetical protein DFP88_102302 [Pseudoroseicyclus aestuarii]
MRALALILALLPGPALAEAWGGFYAPASAATHQAAPLEAAPASGDAGICVREILQAQLRHGIPNNILLGIGLQEAGRRVGEGVTIWPWSVNAAGTGRVFDSRDEALAWVQERQAAGIASIDVGCMQINLRWHPEAFVSPAQGFDPAVNVDYAARFLVGLHQQTGDWATAAGSYHSFTPEKRDIYLASLTRNVEVANARIDSFRALAAGSPGGEDLRLAEAPQPVLAPGGPFWSASLSAGGRRSLYSARDLQPILPIFDAAPAEEAS